jgi:putative Mg2+ transporter-C (MgtC) family protein
MLAHCASVWRPTSHRDSDLPAIAPSVITLRDLLGAELERANYPIRAVETLSDSDDLVERAATLVPLTAELDAVVAALECSPLVLSAT